MDSLAAWLYEQLGSDEEKAKAASARGETWVSSDRPKNGGFRDADGAFVLGTETIVRIPSLRRLEEAEDLREIAFAEHISLHDPQSVLADIEAKRAVLDERQKTRTAANVASNHGIQGPLAELSFYDAVVRRLAQGYRHRTGFRDEWVLNE